jgi:hypothetical protein
MRASDATLSDEAWEIRETYAAFGRAFYTARLLEVGLAHVLMFVEFLLRERKMMVANKGVGLDLKKYQADFDIYMDDQLEQTMGNLIATPAAPNFEGG